VTRPPAPLAGIAGGAGNREHTRPSRHGRFTGERLHAEADAPGPGAGEVDLFAVDLARHRAAYRHAAELWQARRDERSQRGRILDLGSGAGYGTALLGDSDALVLGLDRELPDRSSRAAGARFARGDVHAVPFASATFDLVVSFQVIEHLEIPVPYLREIARVVAPTGVVLLTTPNRVTSDGLNPYHVREYVADELHDLLAQCFGEVEMRGVEASERVAPYFESRRRTLARVERFDFLRLRERLPRALRLWLFARAAVLVRRALRRRGSLVAASVDDFRIGPVRSTALDLLAVCAHPRS
jgi:SAM-dependent methyltransferase